MTLARQFGTTLERSTNGSAYVEISSVISLTIPTLQREKGDTSHLTSTYQVRTSIAGWGEGQPMPFRLYFEKAQYATLWADWRDKTNLYWRVKYPLVDAEASNSRDDFQGWVESIGKPEISKESSDCIFCDVSIMPNGLVTFTSGS